VTPAEEVGTHHIRFNLKWFLLSLRGATAHEASQILHVMASSLPLCSVNATQPFHIGKVCRAD
jgi:hypothetical protein